MLKKSILSLLLLSTLCFANTDFRYRQYLHVKEFYQSFSKEAIQIALKNDIPPAALLAIAAVESGYGRGYVSRITGNILSLGAGKSEPQLPALYLPNLKKDASIVLYGEAIKKYSPSQLVWKKREKSLKKDYRPQGLAGTKTNLDYFDTHPKQKKEANLQCLRDFAQKWIDKKRYKPFRQARAMLDEAVKKSSKKVLFTRELSVRFIQMISGKKNSFNYRKSWAKKVIKIMDNAGLVELSTALEHQSFEKAWSAKTK